MWLTSGMVFGRKNTASLTLLERECHEGEVQPYVKTDYKPMMMNTRERKNTISGLLVLNKRANCSSIMSTHQKM